MNSYISRESGLISIKQDRASLANESHNGSPVGILKLKNSAQPDSTTDGMWSSVRKKGVSFSTQPDVSAIRFKASIRS